MFKRARLRLTIFYTAIVVLIVIIFSITSVILLQLDLATESQLAPAGDHFDIPLDEETVDSRHTLIALTIVNPILLLLSIAAGWLLAGRTLTPIQESMKQQNRFVSDAAHELRTPLAIMKAGLETIEAGTIPTSDDYRQLNRDLGEEIDRIVTLTNDLLFLSRSDMLTEIAVKSDVDLSALCIKNLRLMQFYAAQKEVLLKQQIGTGIHVSADEDQISRLLLNLMKNAIDYNVPGGEMLLKLSMTDKKIVIEVSDTGIGISDKDAGHIFERFYKVDDSRARSSSGTGLGLSIVQTIVNAHNGSIEVESHPGQGTTISVLLNIDI